LIVILAENTNNQRQRVTSLHFGVRGGQIRTQIHPNN